MAPTVEITGIKGKGRGKGRGKPRPDPRRDGSIQNTATGLTTGKAYTPPPPLETEQPSKKKTRSKKQKTSLVIEEDGHVTVTSKRQRRRKKSSQRPTKPAEKPDRRIELRKGEGIQLGGAASPTEALSHNFTMTMSSQNPAPAAVAIQDNVTPHPKRPAQELIDELPVSTEAASPNEITKQADEAMPVDGPEQGVGQEHGMLTESESESEGEQEEAVAEPMHQMDRDGEEYGSDSDYIPPEGEDEDEAEEIKSSEQELDRPKLIPRSRKTMTTKITQLQSQSGSAEDKQVERGSKRLKLDLATKAGSDLIVTRLPVAEEMASMKTSAAQPFPSCPSPASKQHTCCPDGRNVDGKSIEKKDDREEKAEDGGRVEHVDLEYQKEWRRLIEILKNPPKRKNSTLNHKLLCKTWPGSFSRERGNILKGVFKRATREDFRAEGIDEEVIHILFQRKPEYDEEKETKKRQPRQRAPKKPKEEQIKVEHSRVPKQEETEMKDMQMLEQSSAQYDHASDTQGLPFSPPGVKAQDAVDGKVARGRSSNARSAVSKQQLVEESSAQAAKHKPVASQEPMAPSGEIRGNKSTGARARRDSMVEGLEHNSPIVHGLDQTITHEVITRNATSSTSESTGLEPGRHSGSNELEQMMDYAGDLEDSLRHQRTRRWELLEHLDPSSFSLVATTRSIRDIARSLADTVAVTRRNGDLQPAHILLVRMEAQLREFSLRPSMSTSIRDPRRQDRAFSQPPPSFSRRF